MAKTAILSLRILSDEKQAVAGMKRTSSAAGMMGKAVGAAAAFFAVGKVIAWGKAAVTAAGDLEQSMGAIDTVFKSGAPEMHKFAKEAATNVGLTANEYNELGTLIGTQLKNGGTAMKDLGGKTNDLIGLGADLSSMFGGTSADAVAALSSALKGERDPIEKYGVSLNQAKIDAEAAALGFTKVGGSLSAEANQAATLSLIMKQTADAHGNFAKESNTLQGQQQRAAATWKNITTTIGGIFLPIVTAAFGFINSTVLPAVSNLVNGLGAGGMGGAFEMLGPAISTVLTIMNPLSIVWQSLLPLLPQIIAMFQTIAGVVGPALVSIFGAVIPVVQSVIATVSPLITQIAGALIPIITNLATTVLPPVITAFAGIVAALMPVVSTIVGLVVPAIQALLPVVTTVFGIVAGLIKSAMQIITGVIQVATGIFTGNWDLAFQGLKNITQGGVDLVMGIIRGIPDLIGSALGGLGNLLTGAGRAIIDGFIGGLKGAWEAGKDFIGGIGKWIADHKGPISYDRRLLRPAGKAIMGGLVGSMKDEKPKLTKFLRGVTREIGSLDATPRMNRRPSAGTGKDLTFRGKFTKWLAEQRRAVGIDSRLLKSPGMHSKDEFMRRKKFEQAKHAMKVENQMLKANQMKLAEMKRRKLKDKTKDASKAGTVPALPKVSKSKLAPTTDTGTRTAPQAPRNIVINFNGLVTDRIGVAREIKKLLRDEARLVGEG
ncbi:hypothetical protein ACFY5D_18130 [Paeniglutamicibacter sp. NPDC012692]|uniref:phage tail protein n=1 Tax=Paeniglutamicibacter sp. NPDC012692 TaxID=3364388 RepID=UPI0036770CA5